MSTANKKLGVALFIGAVALAAFWFSAKPSKVGAEAPNFSLKTLDGKTIELKQLEGKPVVLDFWATWCPPCLRKLPEMQQTFQHYGDRVQFFAVNIEGEVARVEHYIRGRNLTIPMLIDDGSVAQKYGARSIPHVVLIDRHGKIAEVFGVTPEGTLQLAIERLIANR